MPPLNEVLLSIREQVNANSSRSDVLRPLAWLTGLLLTATVTAAIGNPQSWLVIYLAALAGISILVYLSAYIFFAAKSPDALRSERHVIQKLAIEQGLLGDSNAGILDVTPGKLSISNSEASNQSKDEA